MMAALFALTPIPSPKGRGKCARVEGSFGGGKEVLPNQFARRIGIFLFEGIREVNFSEAGGQIFFVKEAGALDLALEVGNDGVGQRGDAILFAFAIPNGDGPVFKIDILDAQANAIH